VEVGVRWREQFQPGTKFSIQPALNYRGSLAAPGYSYRYTGGSATYIIIPNEVMECNCLLKYAGDGYFPASLSEPMSCIVGAFNTSYHFKQGEYIHKMGIVPGGTMAVLAGAPGVIVYDDPARNIYPLPLEAAGKDEVYVGRVREDHTVPNGMNLWIVSDNLRKGAALNAVQIAEVLTKE
jgi:hypothetical protein